MTKDRDELYGLHIRGSDRPMPFVNPYRTEGELNDIEQQKLARHPLEVVDAIIDTYAEEGPDSIGKVVGEVERMKWAGIYPQKQGGDAFMLRVKIPGGRLTAAQAREIGVVADAFGEGPDGTESRVFGSRYADLTTRQTVQIHWLRIGDIPRVWRRLAAVGLTTVQACGDSARNVLSCPVSGVDADEAFDALPVVQAVSAFFTGNREYANLPRKFKISITGCIDDCAQAEINDIGMWPARTLDGTLGFNLLVGGGLSDGERMASDIDVFVAQDQAVEATRAIAQLYGELGNRENRGQARMRYLVQELGAEGFRAELAARARFDLVPAGEDLTRRYRGDHVGVHAQKEPGLHYVGCSVPVGRMNGIELVEVARLAETYGDGTVRVSGDQNFILTGVPEGRLDDLLAGGPPPEVLPVSRAVLPGGGGLHGQRVLPLRHRGDQGTDPQVGPVPRRAIGRRAGRGHPDGRAAVGPAGGRRHHPDALLGMLGQLCAAPDRRHRLPRRGSPRRQPSGRGGRHRPRWLARRRCRVHRLGRARPPGQRRA